MKNTHEKTIKDIVEGDFCVGCGACAFAESKSMELNEFGEYIPQSDVGSTNIDDLESKAEFVCPFLKQKFNEDWLANEYLDGKEKFKDGIGYYSDIFGGYVKEFDFRKNGSSGGMGSWIGIELLKKDLIDGVIHVGACKRNEASDPFFKYKISRSPEEIKSGAKSKYHVVEISEVMQKVKDNPGRYLFIGVPCMVKALRRLQRIDEIVDERIQFAISLVCGHMKSIHWTLSLGWGVGVEPNHLSSFQYRTKDKDIPARKYIFRATINDSKNSVLQKDSANVVGGKYNQGALMLPACNFCDDVVGETADLTIGDAWLPRFEADNQGTNLLIIRNHQLGEIINKAFEEERLYLTEITAEDALKSQSGGFRHRRNGLSYRLSKKKNKNEWFPEKRVQPGEIKISWLRKIIYDRREEITVLSRKLFKQALDENNYEIYKNHLAKKLKILRFFELFSSFFKSAYTHLKIKIRKVLK